MDGVDYQRQEGMLRVPKAVAVVGCGGVGSWTAIALAMAGVETLWLFDPDTVSQHNLNRIPLSKAAVGMPKANALASLIRELRPRCDVLAMGRFSPELAHQMAVMRVQWVVCTTDTWASRKMVAEWAAQAGVKYVEAAAEGEIGSATGVPPEWATADEARPGYASVPVWVGPCMFAAGIAVAHVLHDREMGERVVRVGWDREREKFGVFDSEAGEMGDEQTEQEEESDVASSTGDDVR